MKKKFIIILAFSLSFLILLTSVTMYAKNPNLSVDLIDKFVKGDHDTKLELKKDIISHVLQSSKKNDLLKDVKDMNVAVMLEDILGDDKKEAIIVLAIGPKKSLVAVYEKKNTNYVFKTILDTFFDIEDIQTMKIKDLDQSIIIVREYVDQLTGAFEEGTYIRAYIFNKDKFDLVLNVTENYKAYWNELWDKKKAIDESHWIRVTDKGNIKFEDSTYPVLRILTIQTFANSKETNLNNIPDDYDFDVLRTRQFSHDYYWSSKWLHFIMGEGIDVKTSEKVAILEDLSNSPFLLADSNESQNMQYRIKHMNGTTEVVGKSQIKNITSKKINET